METLKKAGIVLVSSAVVLLTLWVLITATGCQTTSTIPTICKDAAPFAQWATLWFAGAQAVVPLFGAYAPQAQAAITLGTATLSLLRNACTAVSGGGINLNDVNSLIKQIMDQINQLKLLNQAPAGAPQ